MGTGGNPGTCIRLDAENLQAAGQRLHPAERNDRAGYAERA